MALNEKIINKYLKAAKKDCPKRLQKMLDTELKGSLIEFCNDKVSVTYELLENHFGKPEQCVAEYISSLDGIHINKKLCRSKRIWIAVISALIVIINSCNRDRNLYDQMEQGTSTRTIRV